MVSYPQLLQNITAAVSPATQADALFWASGQLGSKLTDLEELSSPYESFQSSEKFDSAADGILKAAALGPNLKLLQNQANACTSGISLLHSALKRLQAGAIDSALIYLNESRCRDWVLKPYAQLGLLAQEKSDNGKLISRPFSRKGGGFIKGEGSCLLLLENERSLSRTNNKVYAELLAADFCSDGFEIIKANDKQSGLQKALDRLFAQAQVPATAVDYINGYGSGSIANDGFEASFYSSYFAKKGRAIPVSSGKPQFGHLNTAAVGLEICSMLLMLEKDVILPTKNLVDPIQKQGLIFPQETITSAKLQYALKTGFGFGWSNGAALLKKA